MTLTLLMPGVDPQTATLDDAARARTSCWNSGTRASFAYVGQGHRRSRQQEQLGLDGVVGRRLYFGAGGRRTEFVVPSRAADGPDRCRSRCRPSTPPTRTRLDFTTGPRSRDGHRLGVVHDPVDGVHDIMLEKAKNPTGANPYYETWRTARRCSRPTT
jgi:hypothetical protein